MIQKKKKGKIKNVIKNRKQKSFYENHPKAPLKVRWFVKQGKRLKMKLDKYQLVCEEKRDKFKVNILFKCQKGSKKKKKEKKDLLKVLLICAKETTFLAKSLKELSFGIQPQDI